ncbi:MAG: hypothetical protein SWH54_16495 [Thermodesulfobacteriota bacterium]|nr:hypothetical protein [Thermodesulfobacteriota bacterium]
MTATTPQDIVEKKPFKMDSVKYVSIQFAIAFSLIFPLFFQLSGKIYNYNYPLADSGGLILQLPLPISIIGCYIGLLFIRKIKRARLSLSVIFLMFLFMLLTSFIEADGKILGERYKLLLFIQYMLPVSALILGRLFENGAPEKQVIEKAILWTLIIIVPLQLLLTWFSGHISLTHSMIFFGIYQHYQYVSVMMISGFVISLYALWEYSEKRKLLILLALLIGIYAVASYSMLSLFMAVTGVTTFTAYRLFRYHDKKIVAVFICFFIATSGYFFLSRNTHEFSEKYGFIKFWKNYIVITSLEKSELFKKTDEIIPKNLNRRFKDWKLYSTSITENRESFFLGHKKPFDRSVTTSAHNYYLDFVYNFGFLALLPLLFLIGYSLYLAFKFRDKIIRSERLLGLCMIVFFLVLVDNNFKVTLRQPYPGILTFFLWGVLLSRLLSLGKDKGYQN